MVGAAAMLVAVTWYGTSENLPSSQLSVRAGAVAPQFVPVGVAAAAGVPTSAALSEQSLQPATPDAKSGLPAGGKGVAAQGRAERVALNAGYGSAARRDCMAQVESAVLFALVAKGATSRGAYNVTVNREIKRLLAQHTVREPRTLDLIAAQTWAERSRVSASPRWWAVQYRQCEQHHLQGAQYLVRAD